MALLAFVYGLVTGSFLNVLIDRLPRNQNVLWGRSRCDHCKKTLRWYELVPVLSYLRQAGRGLRCHKRLSIQYPLIEVVAGIGFVLLFQILDTSILGFCAAIILFCSLLVITVADLKYQIIPDSMIVSGFIGVGLWFYAGAGPIEVSHHILAGAGAGGLFYLLWKMTKGRGMGFGDVKLAGLLGVFLGYPGIVFALYIAFLTGALVGVILILGRSKTLKSKIAFGPFLVGGAASALVFYSHLNFLWHMYF